MSTRKSERDSPLSLDDRPIRQSEPSTLTVQIREQSDHLAEAIGVRPQIRQLVKDLRELQGSKCHAVWPIRRHALYMKLNNTRKDYKKATQEGDVCSFSIDDIRLLSCLVGAAGPHDQALGAGALGTIEFAAGRSRWIFEDIGTAVSGEWHDTEAEAVDDLVRVQSMLFPDGLPVDDWFDQTRRQKQLQRVKTMNKFTELVAHRKEQHSSESTQPPAKKLRANVAVSTTAAAKCPVGTAAASYTDTPQLLATPQPSQRQSGNSFT